MLARVILEPEVYPIRDVAPHWRRTGHETMGTKKKFWCQADDGKRYLFKYRREGTGEDWSEKVAAEVARALGVPHAEVELASFQGNPGTLTLDFTDPSGLALVHGNELLQERRPDYPAHTYYGASEHTVEAVLRVLGEPFVGPPTSVQPGPGLSTAVQWFLGYLLLDALIGNTDRHHENWGVLERVDAPERQVTLAPSYDHASSLGRELREEDRAARLDGKDRGRTVAAYAKAGRSALYRTPEDPRTMSPIDAFAEAMRAQEDAGRAWLTRLGSLDDATLAGIVNRVPGERASELARRFAIALMNENRRALLRLLEAAS